MALEKNGDHRESIWTGQSSAQGVKAGNKPHSWSRLQAVVAGSGVSLVVAILCLAAYSIWVLALVVILAIMALTGFLVREISRLESLTASLMEGEQRYRYLFDANPHPMWIYDTETLAFLAVNDAAASHYGYSRDEFLALTIRDIRPAEEIPRIEQLVSTLDPKLNQSGVWRHRKKDGTVFDAEIVSHGFDFNGRPARLVQAQDISARARAERQSRESEERYRNLFEGNPFPVWVMDEETLGFLAVNRAMIEKYGYTREELLELTALDIQVEEDRALVARQIRDRNAGITAHYRRRHVTKSGQIIEAEVTAQPFMFGGRPARMILVNDITEKLRAERALQESEQRYRDLFELNPSPMWVYDFETLAILAVNEATVRNYGYTREDFAALTIPDMHPPEDVPEMLGRVRQRDPNAFNVRQVRHRRKDGSILDVEVQSGPISFGRRVARLVLASEITERKRAEIERARLAAIVENTDDAIISRMVDGTLLTWNRGAEKIFGYTAAEIVGQNISILSPPEFKHYAPRNAARLLKGEVVPPFETVRIAKDGHRVDVQVSISAIRDVEGRITGIASIFRDISERKRAEDAVVRERALLRAVVDTMPERIYVKDREGRFLLQNETNLKVRGVRNHDDIVGKTVFDIFPREIAESLEAEDRAVLESGVPLINREGKTFFGSPDEQDSAVRWHVTSKVPLRDAAGDIIGIVGVNRDITERKRAEAERAFLAAIVENSTGAIISRALDGTITSWNAGAERMFGYSASEAIGRTITFILPPGRQPDMARNTERVLRGEVVAARESQRMAKDGQVIDVLVSHSPLRDEAGNISGASVMFHDISALKRAETALRDSEERLRAAFEQAAVGMALRDIDPRHPRWLRVNQKLCDILGYTREELLQLSTIDITLAEDRDIAIDYNEQLWEGKIQSYSREKRYVRKDGQAIWVNLSLSAVHGPDGKPTHTVSIIQDITDHKNADQALRESEERYRRVFEMSPNPILLRRGENVVFANSAALRFFGAKSPVQLIGELLIERVHPDERDSVRQRWSESKREETTSPVAVRRYFRLDGTMVVGETSGAQLRYQGDTLGITVIHDVTDRVKAEEALARERTLLRAVINNLPDFIYVKDRDRRFLLVNPAWFRARGVGNYAETTGKTVFDYFPKEQAVQLDDEDKAVIETGTPIINRELVLTDVMGQKKWFMTNKVPLRDLDGSISGVLGITHEITEIRKSAEIISKLNAELEQRVIERTAQLETTNKELESFAYSVSHDLRAPLRSMDGFSQALLEDYKDRLDATGQDYLRRVRTATQRMAMLIDDLLALSSITRGEMRRATTDLSALAREIVADIRKEQPKREIDVKVASGMKLQADPRLLRVALDNLLRNAWKYTARQPNARIEVGVEQKEGQPVYFVRDNGVGFDMRYAGKLFGAFQRLHSDSDFPGTGIGLATVQRVIRRHGGEIWAHAETGKGATFFFTFGNDVAQ